MSFVGLFVPVIPSILLIWVGFLLYQFTIATIGLPMQFWLIALGLTIILFLADFFANKYFVGKFGGSKWSEWGAVIGVILGVFIYPPIGIIIVPFIIVLVIELIQKQPLRSAMLAAVGAIAGFLSGIFAKFMIQLVLIIVFFVYHAMA